MEKWKDRKKFNFSLFLFSWEWKSGGIEKVNLYKFTHIPLLKKDTQLKPKKVTNNQKKKKKASTKIYLKNHVQKKKFTSQ